MAVTLYLYGDSRYPVVDIPTSGAYIPVAVTTTRWIDGKKAEVTNESKAVMPLPQDFMHSNIVKCTIMENNTTKWELYLPVCVPPTFDNQGNIQYKMSELAPSVYQTELDGGFGACNWAARDFSTLDTCEGIFKGCRGMDYLDGEVNHLNKLFRKSLNFKEAFAGCSSLEFLGTKIDMKALNDANYDIPTYMSRVKDMFKNCVQLHDIGFWNVTNNNLKQVLSSHKDLGLPSSTTIEFGGQIDENGHFIG